MKKFFAILCLLTVSGLLHAQLTVNDANAEVRSVSPLTAIEISHAFDVIITQGNQEALAVSASNKNDLENIKTTVQNGVLKIWYDQKGGKWGNRKLKAYIGVKSLQKITASGASDIRIEGSLSAAQLKVQLSGASDLSGKVFVNETLDISLSGASDVKISGSANNVVVNAHGASDVKAYDFTAARCDVDASGASSVRITVEKELSVKLSGASSVDYKGAAMIKDVKTSGASSVSRKS